MKVPVFLLLIFLLINRIAVAQKIDTDIRYSTTSADDNTICYVPGNKLLIDDFKGEPIANSAAIAITSSGVSFKAGFRKVGSQAVLTITVFCNFNKSSSWMKEHGKNNYVLSHEQHHFDITYLSTLAFLQKLRQTDFTVDNYREKLNAVYTKAMQKMEELQHQYDGETHNGQAKEEQLAWNRKIEEQLQEVTVK